MSNVPRDRIHIQHQTLILAAQHRARSREKPAQGLVLGLNTQLCTWPSRWSIFPAGICCRTGSSVWEGITMMQFVTARSAVHVRKPTEITLTQMAWISWSLLLHMHILLPQNCSSLCTNTQQPQGLASREKLSSYISSCIRSLTRYHIPVPALKCSKGDNLNAGGAGWNSSVLCGKGGVLCSSLALWAGVGAGAGKL